MQENKAIVFVGMPGAGKSLCVDHLKAKGLPSTYFGGITIDEVKSRGMAVNEANERLVREDIRAKEGKGAYAQRIITQIEEHFQQGHHHVVVDGLYSWTEYKIFKETLAHNAVIIAVVAPRSLRHQRLTNRLIRPLNETEATNRDYAEIEKLEKGGPIANADYFLLNTTSTEELLAHLDETLSAAGINLAGPGLTTET
jgi:dephospho-CoA kinase